MDRGSIHDTLRRYWGYDSFRAKQEEIINSVLLGKDTLDCCLPVAENQ